MSNWVKLAAVLAGLLLVPLGAWGAFNEPPGQSTPINPRLAGVGMQSGGADNIPYLAALQTAIMPANASGGGFAVNFPALPGQRLTPYYFSDEASISRGGTWSCSGYSGPVALSGAILVFAPGVDGFRFEDTHTSSDGGTSQSGTLTNCPIYSLGFGTVSAFTTGATTLSPTMVNDFSSAGIPTPSWGAGDGFILAVGQNPYTISSGSVSGTALTVNTISAGTITVGSSWTATNALPNTYISACPGGVCGGAGVYTLSQAQPSTVTSTTSTGYNLAWAPVVPPGAYIDSATGTAPTQVITPHAGFTPTQGSTFATANGIWRLPANRAWTITTVTGAGSNTFTVTAAPGANPNALLEPGDFVWSQPYAVGCVVLTVSGTAGAQTVKLSDSALQVNTSEPACDAASAGSFTLWKIPSAFRPVPQAQAWNNFFYNFPFGINQSSAAGMVPAQNSTTSIFVKNTSWNTLIGFLNGGGNTASTWIGNEGVNSYFADFVENGAVGSSHFGDNSNSVEGSHSPASILGNCTNGNATSWYGNYLGTPSPAQPFCIPTNGMLFQAPNPAVSGNQILYNPTGGQPSTMPRMAITGASNFGNFAFAPVNGQPGAYFNSFTGALYPGGMLSRDGTALHGVGYAYNSAIDAWQSNTANTVTNSTSADCWIGAAYTGYYGPTLNVPLHCFMNGFLIAGQGIVTNGERLVDAGTSAPADASATVTASQAFLSTSTKLAISTVTGVTAQYSIVDTTLSASSVIGTVSSSNSTQNWLTLTAVSSIASTGAADSLLDNGVTVVAAQDPFGVTQTMIPVASCTGINNGDPVTDTTQGGASVGTVSACGTHATLLGKIAMNHASSGAADSLTIVQRRQGDFRHNLTPTSGGQGCWEVTDYAGGVRPGCPISNSATIPDYTAQTIRSGTASNTDLTGRITLSGGTATYTLTETYTSAPNCLTADATTPANASSVSESTTVLTFTGTGTDVIKYECNGRN
jgi:hypothetical protein